MTIQWTKCKGNSFLLPVWLKSVPLPKLIAMWKPFFWKCDSESSPNKYYKMLLLLLSCHIMKVLGEGVGETFTLSFLFFVPAAWSEILWGNKSTWQICKYVRPLLQRTVIRLLASQEALAGKDAQGPGLGRCFCSLLPPGPVRYGAVSDWYQNCILCWDGKSKACGLDTWKGELSHSEMTCPTDRLRVYFPTSKCHGHI